MSDIISRWKESTDAYWKFYYEQKDKGITDKKQISRLWKKHKLELLLTEKK